MGKKAALRVLFLFLLAACTTPKVWRSDPMVQTVANDDFEVQFAPLMDAESFFNSFRLSVTNRSDGPLVIDWVKSQYIYDGRGNGGFAFRGLDAKTIHEPPPDRIAAGGNLSKMIWPIQLIGWVPYRDKSPDADQGFTRGVIPAGENGIDLVVKKNGEEVSQRITVDISSD